MMNGFGHGAMGTAVFGMHSFGWFFQLIILLLFFAVIYWVLSGFSKNSALEILKRRYAAGEISRKEFLKIKRELE